VCIYDSLLSDHLPPEVENQVARIYSEVGAEEGGILIGRAGVQRQEGIADCGVFALAFAYHAARGDVVETLNFNQRALRVHLLKCFSEEMFSPFPQTRDVLPKGMYSTVLLELFCCSMPESYDDMLCCDLCDTWFHYSCVGFKCSHSCAGNCICVPSVWLCPSCCAD
jgi:hypothetical protein